MIYTNKKLLALIAILACTLMVVTGCGPKEGPGGGDYTGEDDVVTIDSPEKGETEITVADLMKLKSVTKEIQRRGDDGEIEDEYSIKGVLLQDVLAHLELSADNLDTLRFTAGDGYSAEVPNNIVTSGEVILAYMIDDEYLYEDTRPIRMFIPGEEAMYWVKNTVKITLTRGDSATPGPGGEGGGALKKIVFFDTLQSLLSVEDYAPETGAKAVKTSELLADVQGSGLVHMLASDGFEKNEELDTFLENFIVVEGDNAPAFRGPDLPRGMHVKNLVSVSTGGTGFLFVKPGLEYFEAKEVDSDSGVGIKDLADKLGLEVADTYILESDDGYTAEVTYEDLAAGIVYFREGGELASAFHGLAKNTSVKHLLSISVGQ